MKRDRTELRLRFDVVRVLWRLDGSQLDANLGSRVGCTMTGAGGCHTGVG